MLLFTIAWSGGVATAQEPSPSPTDDPGPLAVPVDEPPPPTAAPPPTHVTPRPGHRPPRVARPNAPVSPDQDAAHAAAIRQYRDQYLSMRQVRTTSVDVGYDYVPYGVYGVWRRRYGVLAVPHTYVTHGTELGVFEGGHRLDVPATYEALGDQAGLDQLERRIRSNRTWSNLGYGVAVAGIATSVVGLVELDQSRSWIQQQQWGSVTGAGVGMLIGGVIAGAIPSARAQRLEYDHSLSFDLDELQNQFAEHNAQLAEELGLSQTEAAQLERR
jgi:hypothetical protein